MKLLLTVCGVSCEPKTNAIVCVAATLCAGGSDVSGGVTPRSVAVYHASFVSSILLSIVANTERDQPLHYYSLDIGLSPACILLVYVLNQNCHC